MERLGMSRCGRNLIDGRGGDRIVNGLEIVLHAAIPRRDPIPRRGVMGGTGEPVGE